MAIGFVRMSACRRRGFASMAELREDNPRAAALATIGPVDNPEMVALVLGLLYIGDQIGRLVESLDCGLPYAGGGR